MSRRLYRPRGHLELCEIAEYGYPPQPEPARDATESARIEQRRGWVQFRTVEKGYVFAMHRSRLHGLEPEEAT